MRNKHSLTWVMFAGLFICSTLYAAELEQNWNDFLHYTAIGRFELAKSYAEQIITSQPDPTKLLDLADSNEEGYRLLLKMQADSEDIREVSG